MPYMIPARLDYLWSPPFLALELSAGLFRHQTSTFCSVSLLYAGSYLSSYSITSYVLRTHAPSTLCTNIVLPSLFVSLSPGRSTLHTTFYNIPAGVIHRLTPSIYSRSVCRSFTFPSFPQSHFLPHLVLARVQSLFTCEYPSVLHVRSPTLVSIDWNSPSFHCASKLRRYIRVKERTRDGNGIFNCLPEPLSAF
jgi:hypothetical protein